MQKIDVLDKKIEKELREILKIPARFQNHRVLAFVERFLLTDYNGSIDEDISRTFGTDSFFHEWNLKEIKKTYVKPYAYGSVIEIALSMLGELGYDNVIDIIVEAYKTRLKKIRQFKKVEEEKCQKKKKS